MTAKVSGSEIYSVRITIEALPAGTWKSICADCAGRVASLVELLQGRLSKAVMDRVCRQGDGLFQSRQASGFPVAAPIPPRCGNMWRRRFMGPVRGWTPKLLFLLREVDAGGIFTDVDAALPVERGSATGLRLEALPVVKISRPETGDGKTSVLAGRAAGS